MYHKHAPPMRLILYNCIHNISIIIAMSLYKPIDFFDPASRRLCEVQGIC